MVVSGRNDMIILINDIGVRRRVFLYKKATAKADQCFAVADYRSNLIFYTCKTRSLIVSALCRNFSCSFFLKVFKLGALTDESYDNSKDNSSYDE